VAATGVATAGAGEAAGALDWAAQPATSSEPAIRTGAVTGTFQDRFILHLFLVLKTISE
jgi:hypothetical protein